MIPTYVRKQNVQAVLAPLAARPRETLAQGSLDGSGGDDQLFTSCEFLTGPLLSRTRGIRGFPKSQRTASRGPKLRIFLVDLCGS
jgi:hypothetical protein